MVKTLQGLGILTPERPVRLPWRLMRRRNSGCLPQALQGSQRRLGPGSAKNPPKATGRPTESLEVRAIWRQSSPGLRQALLRVVPFRAPESPCRQRRHGETRLRAQPSSKS